MSTVYVSKNFKITWEVSNDCYETVATFAYPDKDLADIKARELERQGNGKHFVRKAKEPIRAILRDRQTPPVPRPAEKPPEAPRTVLDALDHLTTLVSTMRDDVNALRQSVAILHEEVEDLAVALYQDQEGLD